MTLTALARDWVRRLLTGCGFGAAARQSRLCRTYRGGPREMVYFSMHSAAGRAPGYPVPPDEKFPSGVVAAACAPGSESWQALESRWLRPAMMELRAGRIERLQLSAADRSFTLTARGLRRIWRRRKPWWESFE